MDKIVWAFWMEHSMQVCQKISFFSFLGDLRWNFSKYFHFCEKLCAPCDDSQTQIGPVSQQPQLWYSYLYKPSLIARLKLSNLISSRCRDKRRRFRFAISRYQKLKCCCIFFFGIKFKKWKKLTLFPEVFPLSISILVETISKVNRCVK